MKPDWLDGFQARFSRVIRTPLDRSSGVLRATPSAYDPEVGAIDGPRARAVDRLAVYNRQYWFRLFTLFHGAFPLTTRLVGHWQMNEHTARFLDAHAPRGWDIEEAADGFDEWLAAAPDAPGLVVEAARIDAAWRRVFRAPACAPYRPSAEDAAQLLASRLVVSPAVAVIEQNFPLLELRRALAAEPGEAAPGPPARLHQAEWWALVRRTEGIGQLPLEAREAELFQLLAQHTVEEALARLEAACAPGERAGLPARAQAWLARSVQLDFWAGAERDASCR